MVKQPQHTWLEKICAALLIGAVCISLGEIVGRVLFKATYDFVIDLPVWFTIWAMLLISGPLIAENGHVSIDFIRTRLKGKARWAMDLFNMGVTLIYGAMVFVGGCQLIHMLHVRQAVFPKYFPIPKWLVELCIPLGMGLFTLCALGEVYRILKRYPRT